MWHCTCVLRAPKLLQLPALMILLLYRGHLQYQVQHQRHHLRYRYGILYVQRDLCTKLNSNRMLWQFKFLVRHFTTHWCISKGLSYSCNQRKDGRKVHVCTSNYQWLLPVTTHLQASQWAERSHRLLYHRHGLSLPWNVTTSRQPWFNSLYHTKRTFLFLSGPIWMASVLSAFQKMMTTIVAGIPGVQTYLDDMIC